MQIRADRAPEATALEARRAVVPEAVHDASERLGAGIEQRAAGVVLEAGKRLEAPGSSSHSRSTSPIIRVVPATVSCAKSPAPGMNEPSRPR